MNWHDKEVDGIQWAMNTAFLVVFPVGCIVVAGGTLGVCLM